MNILKTEIDKDSENFRHLFKIAVLCNNAEIEKGTSEGDPLEIALLKFADEISSGRKEHSAGTKKVMEDPFDSESKRMITAHKKDKGLYIALKGASSAVLKICSSSLSHGEVVPMSEEDRQKWLEKDNADSEKGLRLLSFAFSTEEGKSIETEEDLLTRGDFVFAGMAGFVDPARQDVLPAMEDCHHAGIRVIMVTGDHPGTALYIARTIHLIEPGSEEQTLTILLSGEATYKPIQTGLNRKILLHIAYSHALIPGKSSTL